MRKLQCVSSYQCRQVAYEAGQVFEVTEEEAQFLQNDSPGSFVPFVEDEPEAKEVDAPPMHKAVTRARSKGRG